MSAPEEIHKLVERFERNLDAYRSGKYNEAQVRQEFINPFFNALGWDIYNKQGYAEAYKDVIHEDAIKVGSVVKAPDYCFRIGGTRKFFLEAKKPAVNIKKDISPAYQLRRYAWSAKLPLSILTDFEELAVYDCRIKPIKTDSASKARTYYLTYTDYIDRWDEIALIFSREAVLKGSFDRYVESSKAKRGTAEVDTAFLEEIDRWREILARNIALRNPGLTIRELNFAVQHTIDRIVFLRICEDRGVELYGRLMSLRNGTQVYRRLCQLFRQADDRYNSGLFHFRKEKDRTSSPDDLTLDLTIDDKTLKDIFKNLYYPDSPYEFSVFQADILGQVYERFLGKVIRLTPGNRAVVENKPEIKKAGGVYYTPTYIVDYIVKHTVGELVEGKKPGPRGAVSKLKILDPACGSGSFLIGAYQYLLDWHRDQYIDDGPEKWVKGRKPRLYQVAGGDWRLTTDERKRILLNNIYGVDIDPQAVEVTKLSLLLKVLEDENSETIRKQLALFHERVLPDLGNNIKCGNSLIGPDFYEGQQMSFLDEEEMYRINVFDWKAEFSEIIRAGGFDAVIGNPPYGVRFNKKESIYLSNRYPYTRKFPDSYCYFMIKCLQLIRKNGFFSLIVPNTFCDLESCNEFRLWFLKNYSMIEIWQSGWAFKSAIVDTLVFVAGNSKPDSEAVLNISVHERAYKRKLSTFLFNDLNKIDYRNSEEDRKLLNKVLNHKVLGDIAIVKAGVKLYEKGKGNPPQTDKTLKERPYTVKDSRPTGWQKLYRGKNIERYKTSEVDEFVNYGPWLAAPRNSKLFEKIKILMRRTDDRILACIDSDSAIAVNSCHVISLKNETDLSLLYVLGLINSMLMQKIFALQNPQMVNKVFAEIKVIYVKRFPIRAIDFSDPTDKTRHDGMVELVEQMLDLHKQLAEAKVPQSKTVLQRQVDTTDRQIDRLVYELYELTEEEIKIVEGS
ncbi:MAG: N-6 DNA methylase [Desulfobacterales bacterium]|nr:N-6 DNA methylase [Desulfobacterales bacterium]